MKTKVTIFFIVLLFSLATQAQTPSWLWAKSAVTNAFSPMTHSVTTDAIGDVIVTGKFEYSSVAFGSTTIVTKGYSDIYIVKYDALGNVLWAKSAGGIGSDISYSVCTDAAGNIFVTGCLDSPYITFAGITITNTKGGFIFKYDANGNELWAKKIGNSSVDVGHSVTTDAAGNVFVTGVFTSYINTGSATLLSSGDRDIFIIKYDTNGNILWAKGAGGINADVANSISIDPLGNAFVTGYFGSPVITFDSTTLNKTGDGDYFIAKYNSNGNVLWVKNAPLVDPQNPGNLCLCNAFVVGNAVKADAAGNVFAVGQFTNLNCALDFGSNNLLPHIGADSGRDGDFFIVKYDVAGNVLWAKSAGTDGNDMGYSLDTDEAGNAFVTGGFNSQNHLYPANSAITFGTTTLTEPTTSPEPMFIVKYDNNGNVVCALSLSCGGGTRNAVSIDKRLGNAYIVSNFASNSLIIGSTTLTKTGIANLFLAKYSCNGIFSGVEEASEANNLSVYPTPSSNYFTINYAKNYKKATIAVVNAIGQVIANKTFNNSEKMFFNSTNYATGAYFLNIIIDEERMSSKLIIQ